MVVTGATPFKKAFIFGIRLNRSMDPSMDPQGRNMFRPYINN